MEKITITIDKKIWKELLRLKISKDLRTFDEVLKEILKKYHTQEIGKENSLNCSTRPHKMCTPVRHYTQEIERRNK